MNQVAIRILLVLTVGGLIGLSCTKSTPNRPPTITSLDLPDSVNASSDDTLNCVASDPDGGAISYNWTCSAGSIVPRTGAMVVWYAPESSGTATITVTVVDDSGASDTASGTAVVTPDTTTIFDWYGTVAAGDIELLTRSHITAGYTVSGSFSVVAHRMSFLVLDSSNYASWRFNQSYNAVVEVDTSAGSNFSAVIPATGAYHFILDNTYNAEADSAHLFVRQASP